MSSPQHASPFPETRLFGLFNASVADNADPEGEGRVLVRLPFLDEKTTGLWARLATLDAGPESGTWFVPEIGDEVIVAFIAGDPRQPVVLGSLWNGARRPPAQVEPNNPRRVIKTRAGSCITLDDEGGQESIRLETAGGVAIELSEDAGGGITLETGAGANIQVDASGVTIQAGGKVRLEGAQVEVSAGMAIVNAGMSNFSGVVKCDTLIANSVVAASYTPGAGNVW